MTEVLVRLQALIEEFSDVSTELNVVDFVVGDKFKAKLPGIQDGLPEQLLVLEENGEMDLALYLADQIRAKLAAQDPLNGLHEENLEPFLIALEGVSHFVVVIDRANAGRQVSALELELQAEIDKFVHGWQLLTSQGAPARRTGQWLSQLLFDSYQLRDGLPLHEQERYRVATRAARGFCQQLLSQHPNRPHDGRVKRAVRQFYRRPLRDKLRAA